MMEAFASLASAATLGLASIPHCIGMCGGIAGACSRTRGSTLAYQAARLAMYGTIGGLAGLALGPVRSALPSGAWAVFFAVVTASALIFSAFRLVRMKNTPPAFVPASALRREKRRTKLGDRVMPLFLGAMTGLLPCGALYGALAVAGAAGQPALGAASMVVFGLTSSVGLLAALPVTRFLSRDSMRHGRTVLATALVLGAVIVLLRPLLQPGAAADCHTSLPQPSAQLALVTNAPHVTEAPRAMGATR